MKILPCPGALAQLGHREFIQMFVVDSRSQPLVREFLARYDPVIRQTVTNVLRRNAAALRFKPTLDESVNEIYCLLFRGNCQALRCFHGRYENAIYAYLRTISLNLMRNQLRDEARKHGFIQRRFIPELAPVSTDDLPAERPDVFFAGAVLKSGVVEGHQLEERIRIKLRQSFRAATAYRNFIIFKLRFLYNYQCHEIARIQALALDSRGVANTAFRIRKRLHREFAQENT